jgi:predicted nucleotidyltransferase
VGVTVMKRATALRYAREISQQLHQCHGVIDTALHEFNDVIVHRVSVFGSTAKGSEAPNDLDLMVEFSYGEKNAGARLLDRTAKRNYGYWLSESASDAMVHWFRKGRKMVSVHSPAWDATEPDVMREIYPEWKL